MHRVRTAALIAAMVLVGAACGARLTQQQREFGMRNAALSGGSPGATVPGSTTTNGGTGATGPISTGGTTSGTTGGGSTSGTTGGGGGSTSQPAAPGAGSSSSSQCGSGGGATDVGVTADTIRVATIYDGTGPQPGLFNSAYQATQALAAYVNSQGGVCGRDLKVDALDDKTDTGDNRAATEQACHQDFAIVGSMSAFDDGGPPVVESCHIPDLPAIPVTPSHQLEKNVHPAYPNRPDYFIEGYPTYIKQHYPDVIKKAGILYLNAAATRTNEQARKKAYEHAGFNFIYEQQVQITEPDYSPYVAAMRQAGVEYVTMVADYQSIARLNVAMSQQGWYPKVRDWDSVVYDPGFIARAGSSANGSLFYLDTAMFEEAAHNPELQLYEYWLKKTCAGCYPTYFGMYAWSAGRLFLKAAADVGAHLTRDALEKDLASIHSWDDYGMHAAHDPGRDLPSPCVMYGKIENGKFVRIYPSSGFNCSVPLLHQSVS